MKMENPSGTKPDGFFTDKPDPTLKINNWTGLTMLYPRQNGGAD